MNTNSTLIRVKKKMVDLGFDGYGSRKKLAGILGTNYNSLSMALTGHREQAHSVEILNRIEQYLDELLKKSA